MRTKKSLSLMSAVNTHPTIFAPEVPPCRLFCCEFTTSSYTQSQSK
jgi:hypothetical protein